MKINKKIFLFTYGFPSGNSEDTFIKYELNKLISDFKNVVIIPQKKFKKNIKKKIGVNKLKVNFELSNNFNIFNFIINYISFTLFSKIYYKEVTKIFFKKNFFTKFKMVSIELTRSQIAHNWISKTIDLSKNNIIFYSFWSNYLLLTFERLKKEFNIKTISRILGSDLNGHIKGDEYVPFIDYKFYSLNKLLLLSNIQKSKVLKKKLINKNKIKIAALGVYKNTKNISKAKVNEINFLSCNNLIKIKNNFEMINFVKFFSKNTNFKVNYYIIGNGEEYNNVKNKLIDCKSFFNFKLIKRVNNLTDFIQEKKINFFINLSSQEGMSFSIMESLSCGVPVICSDIKENKLLVNKKRGYIIKLNNLKYSYLNVSRSILKDFLNRERYLSKKRAAKSFINKNLLNKNCYPHILKILKEI
tara:strand:+ start:24998 stop:26242 length:1245 start_codon:yes stop_codon:yes gene_type:complete